MSYLENDRPARFANQSSVVVSFPKGVIRDDGWIPMERINQFDFYELGKEMQDVSALVGDVSPDKAVWALWAAEAKLKNLLAGRLIPLGISHQAAQALLSHVQHILKAHFQTVDDEGKTVFKFPGEGEPPIPEWRWNYWRTLISTFETIFSAEMREATTYFVPRRGIFSTAALVDSADESFPASVLPHLPAKTREDWKAAGRCLAFNLLSASGFHVARAVEGTLEAYYQLFSGKPGATLNGWNDYVLQLEAVAKAGGALIPEKKTLAEIKQMKDDYRNPIMHPRVVLSESDARMLFDNGESVIIAMGEEIRTVRNTPASAAVLLGLASAVAATTP